MTIVDAAKKLLANRRQPLKNPEIAAAFKAGGLALQSAEPANTVGSVLTRRFNEVGDIVKVGRGTWSLAEWYPNRNFKKKAKEGDSPKGATFHGLDRFSQPIIPGVNETGFATNEYTATYKAWVTQFNAYWDIMRWDVGCCGAAITPYVGGGIGFAKYWVGNFTDVNTPNNSVFFAGTNSGVNFAWNLQAGLALDVTQNFTSTSAIAISISATPRAARLPRMTEAVPERRSRSRIYTRTI